MIRAITFDFWDTLALDDSDEPRRAAAGLLPKPEAREALVVAAVGRSEPRVDPRRAAEAWRVALARFTHAWKVEHHTPSVATRIGWTFEHLELPLPAGTEALVEALERMEVEVPPDPIPGVAEALAALAARYPLGIVSDTIVTPGRGLREILDRWGLLSRFRCCVFSDEVGAAKPSPEVFAAAARGLGVEPESLVHVGDREENDVVGPHRIGARAILCAAAVDRGAALTAADAVFDRFDALPGIVEALDRRTSS